MTQEEALNAMKMGYNVFLTGPPGSGKTFLLNKYIDYLRENNKSVAVTASTGIAATHMNGTTLHSWSGLGIKENLTKNDIKKLMKKSYLRKHYKNTKILIIDEISMLTAAKFDAVNRACQQFKSSFQTFGGMQVVCSGDLFQLPPINKNSMAKFVVESRAWKNMDMKTCYLEEQHRHKDKDLFDLLNHIRSNNMEESKKILMGRPQQEDLLETPTKLYTHNIDVDAVNSVELEKIAGKEFVYHMTATGKQEVVNALKKSCLAPERLVLKKGARVMFLKNNFEVGYVNGTQGSVIDFDIDGLPIIETIHGQKIIAKLASWTVDEDGKRIARINQLPLRLAWAITVHKSQGMNLDAAEIDLSKCFVEGMGYVALSRLRSLAGLKLVAINDMAFCINKKAFDVDEQLRKASKAMARKLKKISLSETEKRHKRFLMSTA
ncbi:MAG: PIF1 family DEAD/DEAH box helicase [Candidatus Nealsonbacteria bacterium]|nr:PIF1 family DEAD/DEAH box helicase [Candidatus Nealsonbacteria bacterium]